MNYNSSANIEAFLASPQNRHLLTNKSKRVFIAFCYKYDMGGPVCKNKNWVAFTSDFVSNLQKIVAQHQLNLEFVMDGAGTALHKSEGSCLKDMFQPFVSTWNPLVDPIEALDSDSGAYKRYQVMNLPVTPVNTSHLQLFEWASVLNYGKFQASSYDFQVWEPSDVHYIDLIAKIYVKKALLHEPTLRFAINIDPVQFQLYASAQTQTATATVVHPTDKPSNMHPVFVASLPKQNLLIARQSSFNDVRYSIVNSVFYFNLKFFYFFKIFFIKKKINIFFRVLLIGLFHLPMLKIFL